MINKSKPERSSYSGQMISRLLRPIFSIALLSSLVLMISYGVKGLSELKPREIARAISPILAKVNINIDENEIEQVAGAFVSRVANTDISNVPEIGNKVTRENDTDMGKTSDTTNLNQGSLLQDATNSKKGDKLVSIALLSDVHSDYDNLSLALEKVKDSNISTFFFLGDSTELGVLEDLQTAKKLMDDSSLEYYAIAGDHDLWQSVGHDNFTQVFGKKTHTKTINNVKFVLFDNAANFTPIDASEITWFKNQVVDADYVILSQPLYHPTLGRMMGVVDGAEQPEVLNQAQQLLKSIRESNVKAIIAGDHHLSSENVDPMKLTLKHIVVGALTNERNLQTPRFSILDVYTDKSFDIQDIDL